MVEQYYAHTSVHTKSSMYTLEQWRSVHPNCLHPTEQLHLLVLRVMELSNSTDWILSITSTLLKVSTIQVHELLQTTWTKQNTTDLWTFKVTVHWKLQFKWQQRTLKYLRFLTFSVPTQRSSATLSITHNQPIQSLVHQPRWSRLQETLLLLTY